jgi:acetoin utilization deacetylase AcuC-like enzyme
LTIDRVGQGEHCFALVRPPGHHAEPDRAMGFCIFNNAAVAAAYATASGKRVAIIDWDVHHGNGTQKIFYSTDKVLYCSIHQVDLFPGTGWIDEIGSGAGKGCTLNIPIRSSSTISDYVYIANHVIIPAVDRFSPDVMIISAGQDSLADDPVGGMALEPSDFGILTGLLAGHAKNPLALVLEGGYGPSLRPSVHSIFRALQGEIPEYHEDAPKESTVRIVSQLKKLVN